MEQYAGSYHNTITSLPKMYPKSIISLTIDYVESKHNMHVHLLLSQLPSLHHMSLLNFLQIIICYNISQITDKGLNYLSNSNSLESVMFAKNQLITDNGLEYLSKLSLKPLRFSNINVTNIGFQHLSNINTLCYLDIFDCKITKIYPINNLKLLTLELDCCNNIMDIEHLSKLQNLEYISLRFCAQITNFHFLSTMSSLQKINLELCQIANLNVLSNMHLLQKLDLSMCIKINDLSPLSTLCSLQELILIECSNIINLEPLSTLMVLQYLNLSRCNNIKNLNPLLTLNLLKSVEITGCHNITEYAIQIFLLQMAEKNEFTLIKNY